MGKPQSTLWEVLGGVRFCLASIVVAAHFKGYFNLGSGPIAHLSDLCACSAVLSFLVISGFSIAHSVSQRTDGFYTRRLLRIYPLYALAVLASIPGDALHGCLTSYSTHVIASNLMFQQTFRYPVATGNPVIWSLAVEAAFYALAPLLARMRTGPLAGIMGLSAVAFLAFPHTGLPYFAWLRHGEAMLFLGWAWMAGFIYYRVRDHQQAGLALIGGMVLMTTLNDMFTSRFHEATIVVAMMAVVAGGQIRLPRRVGKSLGFLGDLSYPLYLFHAPVMFVYVDGLHRHDLWLLTAVTLLVSAAMLLVDALLKRPAAGVARAVNAVGQPVLAGVTAGVRVAAGELAAVGRPVAYRLAGLVPHPPAFRLRPTLAPYANVAVAVGLSALATAAAAAA